MAAKPKPPRGRPFPKGQSGNPGGRPSTKGFREWLGEQSPSGNGLTLRENYRLALYTKAINSRAKDQMRALELIAAYDMGKPIQGVEVSGPGGEPLKVEEAVIDLTSLTSEQIRKRLDAIRAERDRLVAGATNDGTSSST